MRFQAKIRREGNSIKVYIPKEIRDALKLEVGEPVTIDISIEPKLWEKLQTIEEKLEELEDRIEDLEEKMEEEKNED